MNNLNKYERHAYLYSAWTAMFVPIVVFVYYLFVYLDIDTWKQCQFGFKIISIFIPVAIVGAALGFFCRELFRQTSKRLFQFKLFQEDETKMPTTEYLLYKNHIASCQRIDQIRKKVKLDFGSDLPTEKEQQENDFDSRLRIVEIVGAIRKVTHGEILTQANYRYGFRRNLLGGLIWAFFLMVVLLFFCLLIGIVIWPTIIGIIIISFQFFLAFMSLQPAAKNYARTLFDTFLTTNINK